LRYLIHNIKNMKNDIRIRTLTGRDVGRLAVPGDVGSWAVSLYLGIRADQNFTAVANAIFTEEDKKIEDDERFSEADRRRIRAIFARLEQALRLRRLDDHTQTYVAFFPERGRGNLYKLPVYIPSRIAVERDFYVHPFIKSLDKYPRYCVLFLERDRARIFSMFWGEVDEKTQEIRSEVPQRMNAARASWKGLAERRVQNHIEVHIDRHLKKVADAVDRHMAKNRIPYLVLGSRRELIERFQQFLPTQLRKKVVGSYLVRTDQDIKRIEEKSLEVINGFELARENEVIGEIRDGKDKKRLEAVVGVEAVLKALYDYKIRTLVMGGDYRESGYMCEAQQHPFVGPGKCPICSSPAGRVGDIADSILQEAVRQKARIVHFRFQHPDFDHWGVGAILK